MAVDEIKQRLGVIQKIEKFLQHRFPDWRLSAIYLPILVLMPLDDFRDLSRLSQSSLKNNLGESSKFIAYFKFPLGKHFSSIS